MAHPLPSGLTPNETAFLCEMELVTVVPRQKLHSMELLGGSTLNLTPPFPASLPLWLALLLKKQKRANILPPPWLNPENLTQILEFETDERSADVFSPSPRLPAPSSFPDPNFSSRIEYLHPTTLELSSPFLAETATSQAQPDALPYHWLELGHLLLTHAADDFHDDTTRTRQLLQDLREVRASKLRRGFGVLDAGAALKMNGVGGLEIAEVRGFVSGVVDGLRRINRSREDAQAERDEDDDGNNDTFGRSSGYTGNSYRHDDDDDEMQL